MTLEPKGVPGSAAIIVVSPELYTSLNEAARSSAVPPRETIGALLGSKQPVNGNEQIFVKDILPLSMIASSEVPFIAEQERDKLNAYLPDNGDAEAKLQVVGWFYADSEMSYSIPRLKIQDVWKELFPNTQLFLLVNTETDEGAFCIRQNGAYKPVGGFYESLPDVAATSSIPWNMTVQGAAQWLGAGTLVPAGRGDTATSEMFPTLGQSHSPEVTDVNAASPPPVASSKVYTGRNADMGIAEDTSQYAVPGTVDDPNATAEFPVIDTIEPAFTAHHQVSGQSDVENAELEIPISYVPNTLRMTLDVHVARVAPGRSINMNGHVVAGRVGPRFSGWLRIAAAGLGGATLMLLCLLGTMGTMTLSATSLRSVTPVSGALSVNNPTGTASPRPLSTSTLTPSVTTASTATTGSGGTPTAQVDVTGTAMVGVILTAKAIESQATSTATATETSTGTPTYTEVPANTPVPPTAVAPEQASTRVAPGNTPTRRPTNTSTPTSTSLPTRQPNRPPPTATRIMATSTNTPPVPGRTPAFTSIPTRTPVSLVPTLTPVTGTATLLPTLTFTPVPSDTPSAIPTSTPAPLPPTNTAVVPVQPTNTLPSASTPVPGPTNTPIPQPTDTPAPEPEDTPVPQPTDTPIPQPTDTPEPQPTRPPVDTPQPTTPPVDTPQPTIPPVDTPRPTLAPVDTPRPTNN